jgi:regulator of protease activity HflC (stomatin/prohibitin superfamily)
VRDTAIASLNSIIRSTSLAEVAQSKEIQAKKADPNGPAAPQFFDKVHDEFIHKLHTSFMEQFGINVCNIRIESFQLLNEELATNISRQALMTAQTSSQLSNLAGQTEIATAQQKRDAEVARIKAEGDSMRLKTETDAKNRTRMETARVRHCFFPN